MKGRHGFAAPMRLVGALAAVVATMALTAVPARAAAPANDHASGAFVLLPNTTVTTNDSNVDATTEGASETVCQPGADRTVWFRFTAPGGKVTLSTRESPFDTVLTV